MSMFTFESAFPVLAVETAAPVARRGRRRHVASAPAVKEYAQMTTAEKRLFNLEKARAARTSRATAPARTPSAPATPAKAATSKKAAYVRTYVKLTNLGHGRREGEIDGVKVGIRWNGAASRFEYVVGAKAFVGGATRDLAVAKLNAALAEQGLPPVRA